MTAVVVGDCLLTFDRMIREVRPFVDNNGGAWRRVEPTGETFFRCRTHGIEEYGVHADIMIAARKHTGLEDAEWRRALSK